MALQFWPRGGSAQVVRYLAPEISAAGWPVALVTGSLGGPGDVGYAPEFFAPTTVTPVDYTAAMQAFEDGGDPFGSPVPLHPSFEDRAGAPDRVYASVDDADLERQVQAWVTALQAGGVGQAAVAHLHHLTPIAAALDRVRPRLPQITQLHGTDMNMIEAIRRGDAYGESGPWKYAQAWDARMTAWAERADRLITGSPTDKTRALDLFDVPAERIAIISPGVDQRRFSPSRPTPPERMRLLEQWLVAEPRGWDESGVVGSVRYTHDQLAAFADPEVPVLIFVGRFTEQKRLPLLLRAYSRARRDHGLRAPLLVWGGFPGEWEGEHPLDVVRETGDPDVFLAGWHGHEDLPDGLNAADLLVLPSVHEQFGAVIVEAMACGLPAIAVDAHGPGEIIEPGETGWLVPPDDEQAMADALVEAVNGDGERRRRGERARELGRGRYSWPALAGGLARIYDDVVAGRPAAAGAHTLIGAE
jgi:glycosyltransferase involved in cell wall biosynthesis